MNLLEKDLEEIIYGATDEELVRCGLYRPNKLIRQLRIGNYGIADMVGFEKRYDGPDGFGGKMYKPVITIYELKKEKVSVSVFLQALNYAKGIAEYIRLKQYKNLRGCTIEICLIGKSIDTNSSFIYLTDYLMNSEFQLHYFTYKYELNGLAFKRHSGYHRPNHGFKLQ